MEKLTFCFTPQRMDYVVGIENRRAWQALDLDGLAAAIRNAPPEADKGDAGGILNPGKAWPFRPSNAGGMAAAELAAGMPLDEIASKRGDFAAAEAAALQNLRAQPLFVADVDICTPPELTADEKKAYKAEHRRHREEVKKRLAAHPSCLFATLSHNAAWAIFRGDCTEKNRLAVQKWINSAVIESSVASRAADACAAQAGAILATCRYEVDARFFQNDRQCRYITHDAAPIINRGAVPMHTPTAEERAEAFRRSAIYDIAKYQTAPFFGLRDDLERMRRAPWTAAAICAAALPKRRTIETPDDGRQRPFNPLALSVAPSDFGKSVVFRLLHSAFQALGVDPLFYSPKTHEGLAVGALDASGLQYIRVGEYTPQEQEEETAQTTRPRGVPIKAWRQVRRPRGFFVLHDEAADFFKNAASRGTELAFLLEGLRMFWDGCWRYAKSQGAAETMPEYIETYGAGLFLSTPSDSLDFMRSCDGADKGAAKRFLYFALSKKELPQDSAAAFPEAARLDYLRAALDRIPRSDFDTAPAPVTVSTAAAAVVDAAAEETKYLTANEYRLHVLQVAAAEAILHGRDEIQPDDISAALWIVDGEAKSLDAIRSAKSATEYEHFSEDLAALFVARGGAINGKSLSKWLTNNVPDTLKELRSLAALEDRGLIDCVDALPPSQRCRRLYRFGTDDTFQGGGGRSDTAAAAETRRRKAAVLDAAATSAGLHALADEVGRRENLIVKTETPEEITLGHEGSANRRGGFQLALKGGRLRFTNFALGDDGRGLNGDAFNLADYLINGHITSARAPERMSAADFGRCLEWLERVLNVSAFAALEGGER